jgi:DNA repair protein RecO (recombination protein O)
MLVSTEAIVLSKIKYKENDLIVKCFTAFFGTRSYLIRGALKNRKGPFRAAYFQPLSMISIEAEHKDIRSLQYLKDLKILSHFDTIHRDIEKSTVALFLSEVLGNLLNEDSPDPQLYEMLSSALNWFDHQERCGYFHLLLLIKVMRYLGCSPEEDNSDFEYFNMESGRFMDSHQESNCISGSVVSDLKTILGMQFDNSTGWKLPAVRKQALLKLILDYLERHVPGFRKPKSVVILNQVFN